MSMSDKVADMLTRIRNGQSSKLLSVNVISSFSKVEAETKVLEVVSSII